PGLHTPHHKLGEYMVGVAEDALKDGDIILWVLDVSVEPTKDDLQIAALVNQFRGDTPVVLALNKVDLVDAKKREAQLDIYGALVDNDAAILLSAIKGDGVSELVDYLREGMPEGPRYYPVDQVSEVNMRFIAAEVIREKIILNTEQEIPYSVAVEVEEYKERSDKMTYISATIYVERDSQKGILIGKSGDMIKRIGSEARTELAEMLGTQVYIELRVKVLKNWRMDEDLMRRLGYRLPKKED
ncbi:MAG: GTPase Era, partial [Anaerolineae bacterium]|nr:GTPase Era [Anaerolineae bacterium]